MDPVPPPSADVFEIPLDDTTWRILEEAPDALRAVRDELAREGVRGAGPGLANGSLVVARPAVRATLAGLAPDRFPFSPLPGPSQAGEESTEKPFLAVLRSKVAEEARLRGWL